jgi:hypothetical protein
MIAMVAVGANPANVVLLLRLGPRRAARWPGPPSGPGRAISWGMCC